MKDSKRNIINLIFSSFLVIGFIVCTYFFSGLADEVAGFSGNLIKVAILLVFGLLLFYATRVGEGKQVKRFSLPVLLLLDVPCIYIILAALIDSLPLHEQLAPASAAFPSMIVMLAVVALGYGIPYTFLSGYEIAVDDEGEEGGETDEPIEGGIAEELAEAEKEDEKESEPEEAEENKDSAEEEE